MLTPLPITNSRQLPSIHRPCSFLFKNLPWAHSKCWALVQLWWQRETKGPQEHCNLVGNSHYKQIRNSVITEQMLWRRHTGHWKPGETEAGLEEICFCPSVFRWSQQSETAFFPPVRTSSSFCLPARCRTQMYAGGWSPASAFHEACTVATRGQSQGPWHGISLFPWFLIINPLICPSLPSKCHFNFCSHWPLIPPGWEQQLPQPCTSSGT